MGAAGAAKNKGGLAARLHAAAQFFEKPQPCLDRRTARRLRRFRASELGLSGRAQILQHLPDSRLEPPAALADDLVEVVQNAGAVDREQGIDVPRALGLNPCDLAAASAEVSTTCSRMA